LKRGHYNSYGRANPDFDAKQDQLFDDFFAFEQADHAGQMARVATQPDLPINKKQLADQLEMKYTTLCSRYDEHCAKKRRTGTPTNHLKTSSTTIPPRQHTNDRFATSHSFLFILCENNNIPPIK